jgi:SAM-dependent methyltransferase
MTHAEMLMRPDEYRVMFQVENEYWWYRGLRELLKRLLPRYTRIDGASLILDAGCGTGANLKLLEAHGRAIGIDIAAEAIAFCHHRGIPAERAFLASVTDLPFASATFDLAVSFDVICNIPEDVAAFQQIARVLKPGGYLIVQLPAYQWLWGAHDVAVGHQRRYSSREIRAKLARAGLHVERVLHTNALLLPVVAIQRWLSRRALKNNYAIVSDLQMDVPSWVNALLSIIYRIEIAIEAWMDFPFGLSIIAIARRPTNPPTN